MLGRMGEAGFLELYGVDWWIGPLQVLRAIRRPCISSNRQLWTTRLEMALLGQSVC